MRIAIIDGHPDPGRERFCHALSSAYAQGARAGGHELRVLTLAELEIPFLRSQSEWMKDPPPQIKEQQSHLLWADHLVIIYPLWLGDMPALLKAYLEQIARPGFAFSPSKRGPKPGPLKGKSARVIVTMGMPAAIYRWFFLGHSLRSFKRNILGFVGVRPVRETIIGAVETANHQKWLAEIEALGRAAR